MSLPREVEAALALPEVEDAAGLRTAWTAPFRLAVAGVTGVGKTTLANRLTGQQAATGLGGVTRGVQPLYGPERVVLDTEGIDDERVARAVLAEPLAVADAIAWVLDGRAPSTATERRLLAELRPAHTPLYLLVARADLLEAAEREAVLARAARLHPEATGLFALDLRDGALPEALLATRLPSPTRRARVRGALRAARARLPAPPEPEAYLHDLRRAWRAAVLASRDAVLADVEAGTLPDAARALDSLGRAASKAGLHVRQVLEADPFLAEIGVEPPVLPTLRSSPDSPFATLRSGMAGQAGARREVRAAAGRWLAEGDAALLDWEHGPLQSGIQAAMDELDRRHLTYEAALAALEPA